MHRDVLESRLTHTIRRDLLRPEVVDAPDWPGAVRRPNPARGRRLQLEHEVERLVGAVAKGLLSPALAARLQAAERELAALQGSDKVIDADAVLALVGPAVEDYRKRIERLPETIRRTPDVARKVIRDGVGPIVVAPRKDADGSSFLVAKMWLELQPSSRQAACL